MKQIFFSYFNWMGSFMDNLKFDYKTNDNFPFNKANLREVSQKSRESLCRDVSEAVGKVPIVRINRISEVCDRQDLYLKLESCNPGGSIKEKNAVYLIMEAEKRNLLRPGGTIVESSSGNFGIGLAMVGAARGYRVIIVVDAKTPPPVRRMLKAYGAQLEDVPLSCMDENGSMQKARMKRAEEITREIPGAWYVCQHLNPLNPVAHNLYTAKEIEEAFQGAPDVIVVGISTAGQLAGITSYFRERNSNIQIIGVDVAGSAILGTPVHPYKMTGLGLSFVPPAFNGKMLDGAYSVSDQMAFSVCHALAQKEGLLLGASTGAIVAAGINFAMKLQEKKRILMVNPDRGDRYLETVYSEEWLKSMKIEIFPQEHLDHEIKEIKMIPQSILRNQTFLK